MPRVIQVIESEVCRGKGKDGSSMRAVTQYHTIDGDFLAEDDPCIPVGYSDEKGVYVALPNQPIDMPIDND